MADITVRFFNDEGNGTLKVTWSKGAKDQEPFSISTSLITQRADSVRDALQDLVEAGRTGQHDQYDDMVRTLAQAGHELYEALFFGEDDEDRRKANHARSWVENKLASDQDVITFNFPSRKHFPWGLIYDRLVTNETAPAELRKHFWCVKYSATTHYFVNLPEWEENSWPAENFGLLFGADETIWTTTSSKLNELEKRKLFSLLGQPPKPEFALAELSGKWRDKEREIKHGLLTFYCHAAEDELEIGGKRLTSADFKQMFARSNRDDAPPTLVFLAGCRTAVGRLNNGYFKGTAGPGFCGFIGTEVKVPDVFTLRFLARFLDRLFCSGQTLRQVMQEMRLQHWPLSLAFSVCCSDLRLIPPAGAIPMEHDLNLSNETVSSE